MPRTRKRAAARTLSWKVTLGDLERGFHSEYTVVARSASQAESRALELCGPRNDGLGHVYRLQATRIHLLASAQ
jgi:hypothetical protein